MTITLICVHCSATGPSQDIGAKEIDEWHRSPPRNWSMIGYNYVIRRDGRLEKGRPEGATLAHAEGYNQNAIAICLVGGVMEDGKTPDHNFTNYQMKTLRVCVEFLTRKYPEAEVLGHRDLAGVKKDCPSFEVSYWLGMDKLINPRKVASPTG